MTREYVEPTLDEHDHERHPAWTTIGASRISNGGGVHLFDSDVLHQHTVRIAVRAATRKRDPHNDRIRGGTELVEVELSEAQWASFVSAMNSGTGVPCTLRYTKEHGYAPDFPHQPRLAQTIAETHRAARDAYEDIQEAFTALESATTAREKREAMSTLRARINNAVPNVDFAGKQLIEHAEDVVMKAKADVEAFVTMKARQLGIDTDQLAVELPSAPLAIKSTVTDSAPLTEDYKD